MVLVAAATERELHGFRPAGARVLVTGMGARAARRAVSRELAARPYRALVSTGFSGGLDPRLGPGRIVVDAGRSDPGWAARFLAAQPDAETTRFAVVAEPLGAPEDKAALFSATGCGAVDMESDAVAEAAAEAGVRALFVRVVLDDHATPVTAPVMEWCGGDGRIRAHAAAGWALGGPGRVRELIRLARMAGCGAKALSGPLGLAIRTAA